MLAYLFLTAMIAAGCAAYRGADGPIVDVPSASKKPVSHDSTEEQEERGDPGDRRANPFAGQAQLSIDQLVAEVLSRNPTLAQMTAASQAAAARYPQVISLEDPMLGTMLAPASIGSNSVEFGYRVEVSQKYPFPGKRDLRGQNALAEASAADNDLADMRLQLVESAKDGFYEYFLVQRALAVNEESLRLLKEFRRVAQERYETVKTAAEQDVFQADVEIGKQQQRGLILERMRKVAIARLNTLMHLPPEAPLPPPPEKAPALEGLPAAASFRSQALAQRPDLRALEDRLRAEQAALELAQKEFYPDFEATAAYDTIMGNGPTRDLAGQVGVRINLPVRKARRYGAVAEAEARVAQRRAELDKLTDQLNFQVHDAYERVFESEKTVQLYEKTILPAARKNIEAARSAYETGKIPFLSLVEAERSLVPSECP
jgi:outer membrane protein TolC